MTNERFEGGPAMQISRAPTLSLESPLPFPTLEEPAGGREGVEELPGGSDPIPVPIHSLHPPATGLSWEGCSMGVDVRWKF